MTELLQRSLYAGLITIPKWGIENQPGKHEPLISYQTFSKVQDVLDGKQTAPARKDLNKDFPLRGFVNCSCCDRPLTAAWSKSRSGKLHPYYLCHTKGCEMKGKSLRRADVEGAFEEVLRGLEPREPFQGVATAMFRDAWTMQKERLEEAAKTIKASVTAISTKIDKLMDRLVDADSPEMIAAYEARLKRLQHEKRLGEERLAGSTQSTHTFKESFEHAMQFLLNPWKIWASERFDLRQAVLRLAFAAPLIYDRETGLRTAKTTLPFKYLAGFGAHKCALVDRRGTT
ncbi:MAG: zinc ribbon domain-containing protein [Pseudomonadota bacterium]